MKSMFFLFNPRSGRERMRGKFADVLDIFCKAGYLPRAYVTQEPGDARRIAAEYGENTELFICAGGDGTLNEVVSGIMELAPEKRPRIGYIPAGSTNDFAKSLNIPGDMGKAAEAAVGAETLALDIGRFGNERYFVYIAAFGAFTEVSYMTPQGTKNFLGYQAYLLESVKHMASLKAYPMKVRGDDVELEGDFLLGMVTNSTSIAGFKGLVPRDMAFDDGVFEAMFIRMPKTTADLSAIISCLFLKEEENEHVIRFRTSKLSVETDGEVPWVLDGEYGGTPKQVEIETIYQAVRLARGE